MYTNLSQTCAPYHYRHRYRRRHHCRCRHQFTCIDYKATVSPIECKWCFNPHICGLHKRFKDSVIAEVTETKRPTKSKMKRNSGKRMVCDKFVSSTSYTNIHRTSKEKKMRNPSPQLTTSKLPSVITNVADYLLIERDSHFPEVTLK